MIITSRALGCFEAWDFLDLGHFDAWDVLDLKRFEAWVILGLGTFWDLRRFDDRIFLGWDVS